MISVVIPCYNVAEWLEECVESVLHEGSEVEIILVDNNSSDRTAEVIARLSEREGIRAFSESTPGAPAARNRGLREVQGEYVQFLDADDLLVQGKFSEQLSSPSDIMAAAYIRRKTDGSETEQYVHEDVWKGLFDTRLGITSSNLFRTAAVRGVGGWNEDLRSSQEYDLMFRMLQEGCSHNVNQQALAIVRERTSGQISQEDAGGRWSRYLDLRESVLDYLMREQPAYFERASDYFYQSLFDQIRILSNADASLAISKHKQWIPRDFQPKPSPATGKAFLAMMSIFGFAGATRLKGLLK